MNVFIGIPNMVKFILPQIKAGMSGCYSKYFELLWYALLLFVLELEIRNHGAFILWTWSWHRLVLFDGKMVLKILNFTRSNSENIKEWFTTRTSGWSLRTAVCYKENFCIIRDYYLEHTLLVLPCGLGNLPNLSSCLLSGSLASHISCPDRPLLSSQMNSQCRYHAS